MKKSNADRNIETGKDPYGNGFYHPLILRNAIGGAVLGGIAFIVLVWLITKGIMPVEGWGQLSAVNLLAAVLFGLISGSAIGGLIGSVYGIFVMLKERC